MKNQPVFDPESILILSVRLLRDRYEIETDKIDLELDILNVDIGLKSETDFDCELDIVRFMLYIKITGVDEEYEPTGATGDFQIEFTYIVDDLEDWIKEEAGQLTVSPILVGTISGISYSTARGMIYERTLATDFKGVILPIISPHRLLTEDSYSEM